MLRFVLGGSEFSKSPDQEGEDQERTDEAADHETNGVGLLAKNCENPNRCKYSLESGDDDEQKEDRPSDDAHCVHSNRVMPANEQSQLQPPVREC